MTCQRHLATRLCCAFALTVATPQAHGLFSGHLLYNHYSGKLSFDGATTVDEKLPGSGVTARLLLDPIPLIPVGFEIGMSQISLDPENPNTMRDPKMGGASVGLQAWLPVVPVITPYLRAAIPLGDFSAQVPMTVATTRWYPFKTPLLGSDLGVGLRYAPISLPILVLNIVAEYSHAQYRMPIDKVDSQELKGVYQALGVSGDYTYIADVLSLGLQLGF